MGAGSQSEFLAIGATLVLDSLTADLLQELRRHEVRGIVLKGPALGRLYQDRPRTHEDIDLLVSPSARACAERVLSALGFRFAAESSHARAWIRAADGVTVDLHDTLAGIDAPPDDVWKLLSARAIRTSVSVGVVETLDLPGIALHAALHAAQHGAGAGKAVDDLGRAVTQLDYCDWEEAAELAQRLDAVPALAAGLRLVPSGEVLAGRLRLPDSRRVDVALGVASPPATSRGLLRLASTPGLRSKLALLATEIAPSATFMRAVYPVARRGPLGLATSYAWRPLWLLWHLVPALRALRSARRAAP